MKRPIAALAAAALLLFASVCAAAAFVPATSWDPSTDGMKPKVPWPAGDVMKALRDEENELVYVAETDAIQPGQVVYLVLDNASLPAGSMWQGVDLASALADEKLFTFKMKKSTNGKLVKSFGVVQKKLDGVRKTCIELTLADTTSPEEFKFEAILSFTAKRDLKIVNGRLVAVKEGETLPTMKTWLKGAGAYLPITLWIRNTPVDLDAEFEAGVGGYVVRPASNDKNELLWENDAGRLARLVFYADDDAAEFYPKLSTRWDRELLALGEFNVAEGLAKNDAYVRSFVGNPEIDSSGMAVLELNNPFADEDGKLSVPADQVVIYQLEDGTLTDVTARFTPGTNDEGDPVFRTRLRRLGTYVLSNGTADLDRAEKGKDAADAAPEPKAKPIPNTGPPRRDRPQETRVK